MNHLWQRFLLASALLVGLAIGVGTTVFGYSNLVTVDIHWSVFRLTGVPLWTVAVVPLALILIAGTIYHWLDGLHHFTEHMRHRHRVHELEQEVTRLRAHLDQVLEMPGREVKTLPAKADEPEPMPVAVAAAPPDEASPEPQPVIDTEPIAKPVSRKAGKRPKITLDELAPAEHTNGAEAEAAAVPGQEA